MPHCGGGHHGGGFHGGFHGGSHSHSTRSFRPRYNHHGGLHSHYYIRPGFYYHGSFVPYSRDERHSITNFISALLFFLFSFFFITGSIITLCQKGKYNERVLESRSLELYDEIYDSSDFDYENNILVVFIAYDDNKQYDYISVVGDKVYFIVEKQFNYLKSNHYGDSYEFYDDSTFTHSLDSDLSRGYQQKDIYLSLSNALQSSTKNIKSEFVYEYFYGDVNFTTPTNSSIYNYTENNLDANKSKLLSSINSFYKATGVNVSFVIEDNNDFYPIKWGQFIILNSIAGLFIGLGFLSIRKRKKLNNVIESAIQNGEAEKYFEGEDTFEEYSKENTDYII